MAQFKNAMEIFKLLPKTNCKKCNAPTCLAFASSVFMGQKELALCPFIEPDVLAFYQSAPQKKKLVDQHQQEMLGTLNKQIRSCDFNEAARRTGGTYDNGKLTLKIFGKPFSIDDQGRLSSDIHINPWITLPVLNYVLHCKGVPFTGEWVPFRELPGGREKNSLFVQRSENSFKQIADRYTGLFEDLIVIFSGKQVAQQFDSDISLILYPLPKLPILVCYWKPDEGMESQLNLFFDSSADQNATLDIVFNLTTGIVVMFEKLSQRHGA